MAYMGIILRTFGLANGVLNHCIALFREEVYTLDQSKNSQKYESIRKSSQA
jgi:hypothetical protein